MRISDRQGSEQLNAVLYWQVLTNSTANHCVIQPENSSQQLQLDITVLQTEQRAERWAGNLKWKMECSGYSQRIRYREHSVSLVNGTLPCSEKLRHHRADMQRSWWGKTRQCLSCSNMHCCRGADGSDFFRSSAAAALTGSPFWCKLRS